MLGNQISILGLNISMYTIMFASGIFYAMEFGKAQLSKKYPKLKKTMLDDISIFMLFTGLAGARLWYVTSKIPYYSKNIIEIFQPWKGGIAIQGGLIGAIIGAYLFLKRKNIKLTIMSFLEEIMLFALIGQAFGRWGNFYNQEVYGFKISKSLTQTLVYVLVTLQALLIIKMILKTKLFAKIKATKQITTLEWIKFIALAFYSIILIRLFTGYGNSMVQHLFIKKAYRLPLFLIEGNLNIIAFIIIWKLAEKNAKFSKLGAYFISYGVIRSSLELLRNEADIMRIANVPVSLVLSLIFIAIGFTTIKKTKEAK